MQFGIFYFMGIYRNLWDFGGFVVKKWLKILGWKRT
jgi:hypothetical protein